MPQKAELVDEEAQDADDDGTENGNQDGTDGPGLQAGLDIHAAEAGNHVEVAIVQEGRAHGGQADCQASQVGVDAQGNQHGGDDGRTGDHSGGAGALREAHDGADEQGNQDARDADCHDAVGHHAGSAGSLNDCAQGAAAGGDHNDGACIAQSVVHHANNSFVIQVLGQQECAQAQGDEQSDNGVAEEGDDFANDGGLESGLADEGVSKDQEDGEQQDGEGQAGAGQLFGAEQLGEVFVFQLFAGLDLGVDLIQNLQLSFGVLAAVDLVRNDELRVLVAEPAEQEHGEDEQGDGEQQTGNDEHAKVNVDAFVLEGADNSQRAGGGGNHEVGDIQAHAQDATQTDHGFLGQTGELFCQGGQDDEAGVTEDRDGNNKAGQAQNNVCALNADKLQNGDSHTLGSAAFFQKDTHDAAEADDDTNACHGTAKAAGHGADGNA